MLFALVVSIGEGWHEYSESKWVETTAQIHQCRLQSYQGDRKSPVTISCRIGFRAGGEDVVTKVTSRSTRPGQDGVMQDWVEAHPDGSSITARYNPANAGKVVLVTADAFLWGPHTPQNLRLFGAFAAASLLMLAIARVRLR